MNRIPTAVLTHVLASEMIKTIIREVNFAIEKHLGKLLPSRGKGDTYKQAEKNKLGRPGLLQLGLGRSRLLQLGLQQPGDLLRTGLQPWTGVPTRTGVRQFGTDFVLQVPLLAVLTTAQLVVWYFR